MKRDEGRKETDKLLEQMEKEISKEYEIAAEEMEQKLNKYLNDFNRKNKAKLEALDNGDITEKEYKQWWTNQVLVGNRWVDMRDTLVQDMNNANKIARSIVNGYMPTVYALNHNYGTYEVEHGTGIDTGYTLYNREAVERMMRDNPDLLPPPGERVSQRIREGKDKRWNKQQVRSVMTQSILQGEAIPTIAKRLESAVGKSYSIDAIKNRNNKTSEEIAKELAKRNKAAAIRNARTMTTGAENAGRVDAYKRAQGMGINMKQMWLATLDGRTRDSHRHMDGETIPVGGMFSNGCRFPGDPEGPGSEVYNCRCTLIAQLKGFEIDLKNYNTSPKLKGMTYDEWKESKDKQIAKMTPSQQEYWNEVRNYRMKSNPTEADLKKVGRALRTRMMEVYEGIEEYPSTAKQVSILGEKYKALDRLNKSAYECYDEYFQWRMDNNLGYEEKYDSDVMTWYKLRRFESKPASLRSKMGRVERELEKEGVFINETDTVADVYKKISDAFNTTGERLDKEQKKYLKYSERLTGRKAAEALKKELSVARPVGIPKDVNIMEHLGGDLQVKKAVANAYDFYPEEWVKNSVNHGRLFVGIDDKDNRGYYSHDHDLLTLKKPKGDDVNEVLGNAIHELSHRYERTQDLMNTEAQFYQRRTKGETAEWLGDNYEKWEVTKKDNFVEKYMGKDYQGRAYELLSMGDEYIYTNPAKLLNDKEMMDWIYGILSVR